MRKGLILNALLAILILPSVLLPQGVGSISTGRTSGGGGSGASQSGNNTWTGTNSFIDGNLSIVGSADATKIAKFEVDGFTTANTRVFTLPGTTGNDTFAMLGGAQTFSGAKTFGTSNVILSAVSLVLTGTTTATVGPYAAGTPDSGALFTGSLSNGWHVLEFSDAGFDFANGPAGTVAATNPQLVVHDKDQNTTNYQSIGVSGLSGKFVVTLAEATPTSVVIIPVAAASSVSGQLLYTVHARDATNSQTRSGRVIYSGVAEGVTATCVIGTPEELDNTPTGTLTATVTCTSPANNQIQLLISATSSLTQTTLEAYGTLIHVGAGEPVPQ